MHIKHMCRNKRAFNLNACIVFIKRPAVCIEKILWELWPKEMKWIQKKITNDRRPTILTRDEWRWGDREREKGNWEIYRCEKGNGLAIKCGTKPCHSVYSLTHIHILTYNSARMQWQQWEKEAETKNTIWIPSTPFAR